MNANTSLDLQSIPLSLYIHIPWCIQKCPYCDFNSHTLKTALPEQDYIDALLEDLHHDLTHLFERNDRPLHSIFIGGGTPSLLSPSEIARLLASVKKRIPFKSDIEITMEANPGTVEADKFKAYQAAGVTRISIGVQSFDDQKLETLGRIHGGKEAKNAAFMAHQAKLTSFNLDLMHGLPTQQLDDALSDLRQAIALNPPHLSWYQLTIEPNTQYYSHPPVLPDDDALWAIFEQGHAVLTQAGYEQYETSGYCKPGMQCQHNLNYWRFGDYLGIGCGAHGKITHASGHITRTEKVKHPRGYLDPNQPFLRASHRVEENELAFEFFMNRFRLLEPCPKAAFTACTGLPLSHIQPAMTAAINAGYLDESQTHWQVNKKGRLFLNDLLACFIDT